MRKSVKQIILFRILLCAVSVYTAQSAFAAPVSYENALTYASRFFGDSISLRSVNLSKLNLQESAKAKFQPFYIFNKVDSEGFVIVSGDDNLPQILGYSDKNNFPEDVNMSDKRENFPPQLQWLLEMYSAASEDMAQSQTVNARRYEKSNRPAVLLKTVEWGQGYPYNLHCPDNCITGCGATALATILKYHSDTRKGYGYKEYEWNGRYLSYDFDHTFEWDKMVSSYGEHASYTSENAEAVADLMYACGVLLEMDYGQNGSSSYASKASECARYLNYSPSGWYLNQNSSNISDSQWRDILDEELDAGYPILYRGANSENEGGHIFVVDGRDSNGLYHVNWGWNGYCNGYFALTYFKPETSNDFRYYHGIVHHLRPATGDENFSPLITEHYKGGNGVSMNRENIKANDPFFASVSRLSSRMCDVSISGELALALISERGELREILKTGNYSLPPEYGYQSYMFAKATSSVDANPGDRLALMYKDENEGNTEWTPVSSSYGAPSSIPAYGFSPEYADVSWSLGQGIEIKTTYYQYPDRALKYARYYFKLTVDPEITEVRVTVNDEELLPDDDGWYCIEYVDKDSYTIKAVDPQKGTEGIADMMADPSIPDGVYSLDGVLIDVVGSLESESDTLNKLTSGIYIVKNGNNVKKVVVKN